MEFYEARDVLQEVTTATPDDPVTIDVEADIQDALETMFDHEFTQLPVRDGDRITGVISYRSIARAIKSFDDTDINHHTVGFAVEEPVYVDLDADIYDLFRTLAREDYVLVGSPTELAGIMTRYDVFFFLEDRVRPFLLIGDIESALRDLFEAAFDDVERRIEETFADRLANDPSYTPSETPDDFGFWEYEIFVGRNWETLNQYFSVERDVVLEMIRELGDIRNALFHFRATADAVDTDLIEIAHSRILDAKARST